MNPQAKRQEVKDENPDIKITEISKVLGAKWKALSAEEKKVRHLASPRLAASDRLWLWLWLLGPRAFAIYTYIYRERQAHM